MHYLTFDTIIAGYHYRDVTAEVPGRPVLLVREPDNAADANAISVRDKEGRQLGYFPRRIAAEFTGLVDHRLVHLIGRLAAPGEPGDDPSRADVNPALFVWFYVNEARMAELFAMAGKEYAAVPQGHLELFERGLLRDVCVV